MSMWSEIHAYLVVDTCRDQFVDELETADLTAKELLKHAPHITGSEGDAEVFVNVSKLITGHDQCDMCPYKKIDSKKGSWYCVLEETENDNYFNKENWRETVCNKNIHQDRRPIIVITIIGALRDRTKKQTKKEYDNFKKFIRLMHWDIRKSRCEIDGI